MHRFLIKGSNASLTVRHLPCSRIRSLLEKSVETVWQAGKHFYPSFGVKICDAQSTYAEWINYACLALSVNPRECFGSQSPEFL